MLLFYRLLRDKILKPLACDLILTSASQSWAQTLRLEKKSNMCASCLRNQLYFCLYKQETNRNHNEEGIRANNSQVTKRRTDSEAQMKTDFNSWPTGPFLTGEEWKRRTQLKSC